MGENKSTKTVTIAGDLYDFFEEIAKKEGRTMETIVEAILAARKAQCLGGSDDEIVIAYNRRMGFTQEEHVAAALRIQEEVRDKLHAEEQGKQMKKGSHDA